MNSDSTSKHSAHDMKILLILGCQRSGTSLLASMVGRHRDVNMLYESVTRDIFKLIGKKYQGNKLLVPRQIHMTRRASKIGYLVNRLLNLHFFQYKFQKRRLFPTSQLSIRDYMKRGAKVIVITRDKKSTIDSMIKRANYSRRQAEKEYNYSNRILRELIDKGGFHVNFEELLLNPESVMKAICHFLGLEYDHRMLEGPKYNYIYPRDRIEVEKAK